MTSFVLSVHRKKVACRASVALLKLMNYGSLIFQKPGVTSRTSSAFPRQFGWRKVLVDLTLNLK